MSPPVSRLGRTRRYVPCPSLFPKDSMAEITVQGPDRTCDLRQRIPEPIRSADLPAAAQYRSHIAELSGFARARCSSDAD
ncbi:hypothetical protein SNL152K_3429 [Streptomyces sp. NL15-2K]|nr:hypothetical protein SNL152K_3429 [Streptomyces sp. NL15-2K]